MKGHYLIGRLNLVAGSVLSLIFLATVALAQTTEFTIQGKLPGSFNPATGIYQMEFKLFDAATAGNQIGATISNASVSVTQSAFMVNLDLGAAVFPGADRFLEIAARKSPSDPFAILSPRQKITSAPYSIKSKSADTATFAVSADTANVATRAQNSVQFAGLNVDRFVRYDDIDNVGIGTTSTGSKLAVAGTIEAKSGGFKFPDATTQTTAGIPSVTTNGTLTGNGTSASPLSVASPLMVRDLDNPARQPFFISANQSAGVYTVPAGKRLVIEMVTGSATTYNSNVPAEPMVVSAVEPPSNIQRYFQIAPSFGRQAYGNSYTYFTHSVRFYLLAGEVLYVRLPTFGESNANSAVQLSGYLVDVP